MRGEERVVLGHLVPLTLRPSQPGCEAAAVVVVIDRSACSPTMGGGGSAPRRVSFEADENDNITVVKGVRVRETLP